MRLENHSSSSDLSQDLPRVVDELVHRLPDAPAEPGVVSVWCADLDGGVQAAHDADVAHYAASTMKLPLAVAAHRLHEHALLDLDTEIPVHNRFASAADGSPYSLNQDDDQDDETWDLLESRCSIRTLVEHSLVNSGNLATNLVLERVGAGAVAEVLVDAGCSPTTMVVRGIEDLTAREAGLNNYVTAADLGAVMLGVAQRRLTSGAGCAEIEAVLSRQEHRDGIPAGLPDGTYVANKTGWVDGITHDVALVRPAHGPDYVLVVLTTLDVSEDSGQALVAGLSRAVWDRWPR